MRGGTHRAPASKWPSHPNLRNRPAKPALGRGRLQRQLRRAFVGADTRTTSALLDWCYPRNRSRITQRHRYSVWRVLVRIATPIGRVPPHGAWLWRLRHGGRNKIKQDLD
jgi:hypothetical protein